MPDRSEDRAAKRVDRLISNLVAGRRMKAEPSDAEDQEAIRRASRLTGSAAGYPRMAPEFRARLAAQLSREQPRERVSRRTALVAGLSVAGGVVLGAGVERGVGRLSGSASPRSGMVTPAAQTARWVDVGLAMDDLQDGVPVRKSAGAIEVFVVRQGQGVRALSALCTHQPCSLVWNPSGGSLDCPCHGARFGLDGELKLNVYPYPLPGLPQAVARVRNGRVEVLGTASEAG